MYKLCFHVPASHLDEAKQACFEAGAGRVGNYDQCAWQVLGEGQFRPLGDSAPFIGETHKLEVVAEYKVEMVCADDVIVATVAALKQAHPYEEPAYDVWQLEEINP